eukprot:2453980-Pleurochrysis_carterae.AAC.1
MHRLRGARVRVPDAFQQLEARSSDRLIGPLACRLDVLRELEPRGTERLVHLLCARQGLVPDDIANGDVQIEEGVPRDVTPRWRLVQVGCRQEDEGAAHAGRRCEEVARAFDQQVGGRANDGLPAPSRGEIDVARSLRDVVGRDAQPGKGAHGQVLVREPAGDVVSADVPQLASQPLEGQKPARLALTDVVRAERGESRVQDALAPCVRVVEVDLALGHLVRAAG